MTRDSNQEPTVLVVDDERPIADGFSRILSEEFEVLTAYNGADAREQLDETVDVVVLDRGLPDVPGDVLLDEIHEDEFDCRVAVVSADPPSPDLDCDTYLRKPLSDFDVLEEAVTELVDGNDTSR